MKAFKVVQTIALLIIILPALTFVSCGDDPNPSQNGGNPGGNPNTTTSKQQDVTALLVGKTWKMQSVAVDGVDKSSMFAGLAIAFTNTSMTVTNPGPVWAGVSTWTFTNADAIAFRRNDNINVDVEATASTLKLTLTWNQSTVGPGRASSIAGRHAFTFGL